MTHLKSEDSFLSFYLSQVKRLSSALPILIVFFASSLLAIPSYSQCDCEEDYSELSEECKCLCGYCYCVEEKSKLLAWFKTTVDSGDEKEPGMGVWKDYSRCKRELRGIPDDPCLPDFPYKAAMYSMNYNPALYFGNQNAVFRIGSSLNNEVTIMAVLTPRKRSVADLGTDPNDPLDIEEWRLDLPEVGPVRSLRIEEFETSSPLSNKEVIDYDYLEDPICPDGSNAAYEGSGGSDLLVDYAEEYDFEKFGKIVTFQTVIRQDRCFSINGMKSQIYSLYSDSPLADVIQDGLIPEFMVFDGIIGEDDRALAETYLALKYGISKELDYVSCELDSEDNPKKIWEQCNNKLHNYRRTGIAYQEEWSLYQSRSNSYYDEKTAVDGAVDGRFEEYCYDQDYAHHNSRLLTIGIEDESIPINDAWNNGSYHIWGDDNMNIEKGANGHIKRVWKMRKTGVPKLNPPIRWCNYSNLERRMIANPDSSPDDVEATLIIDDPCCEEDKNIGYCASTTPVIEEESFIDRDYGIFQFKVYGIGGPFSGTSYIGFSDNNMIFKHGTPHAGLLFGLEFSNVNGTALVMDKNGDGNHTVVSSPILTEGETITLSYLRNKDETYNFKFQRGSGPAAEYAINRVCIGSGSVYAKMVINDDGLGFGEFYADKFDTTPDGSTNVEYAISDIKEAWGKDEDGNDPDYSLLIPTLCIDSDKNEIFEGGEDISGNFSVTPEGLYDKIEFTGVLWRDADLFTITFRDCYYGRDKFETVACCDKYIIGFTASQTCPPETPIRYELYCLDCPAEPDTDPCDPDPPIVKGLYTDNGDHDCLVETNFRIPGVFAPGEYILKVYFSGCRVDELEFVLENLNPFPEPLVEIDEDNCIYYLSEYYQGEDRCGDLSYNWYYIDGNSFSLVVEDDPLENPQPGEYQLEVIIECSEFDDPDELVCSMTQKITIKGSEFSIEAEQDGSCCTCGVIKLEIYYDGFCFDGEEVEIAINGSDCLTTVPLNEALVLDYCFSSDDDVLCFTFPDGTEMCDDLEFLVGNLNIPEFSELGCQDITLKEEDSCIDLENYFGIGDLDEYSVSVSFTESDDPEVILTCDDVDCNKHFDEDLPSFDAIEEYCISNNGCYRFDLTKDCSYIDSDCYEVSDEPCATFCLCVQDCPKCRTRHVGYDEWTDLGDCNYSWADNCAVGNDVELHAWGYTDDHTFVWSTNWSKTVDNGSRLILKELVPGTYESSVEMTSLTGCADTLFYTITIIEQLPELICVGDTICGGETNGTTEVIAIGPNGPYTYLWDNGQTTNLATGLAAGVYTVIVTDADGCTASCAAEVEQNDIPHHVCRIQERNPSNWLPLDQCSHSWLDKGSNLNDVQLRAIDGNVGYSFEWETNWEGPTSGGGGFWLQLNNLTVGTWTTWVTVTDDLTGCEKELEFTITVLCNLTILDADIAYECAGDNSGRIELTMDIGTPPYSYEWDNGQNTNPITGLSSGTYSVTVTDANDCTAIGTYEIESLSVPEPVCIGDTICEWDTGEAWVDLMVAEYLWSDGQTTNPATGLDPGSYTVIVTDENGCTGSCEAVIIGEQASLEYLSDNNPLVNIDCDPIENTIDINITEKGTLNCYCCPTFRYLERTDELSNSAGTILYTNSKVYNDEVQGLFNCDTVSLNVSINDLDCLVLTPGETLTLKRTFYESSWSCGVGNMEIEIPFVVEPEDLCCLCDLIDLPEPVCVGDTICMGGTGIVSVDTWDSYLWSTSGGDTTQSVEGVTTGTYAVTVTDVNGCTESCSAVIVERPSSVKYQNNATVDISCDPSAELVTISINSQGEIICECCTDVVIVNMTEEILGSSYLNVDASKTAPDPLECGSLDFTYVETIPCNDIDTSGTSMTYRRTYIIYSEDCGYDEIVIDVPIDIIPDDLCCLCDPTATDPPEPQCEGDIICEGEATGTVSVDTWASYLWSTGDVSPSVSGLPVGTYTVTVTDTDGCTGICDATIEYGENIEFEVNNPTIEINCDPNTETLDVNISGSGVLICECCEIISFDSYEDGIYDSNDLPVGNTLAYSSAPEYPSCDYNFYFDYAQSGISCSTIDSEGETLFYRRTYTIESDCEILSFSIEVEIVISPTDLCCESDPNPDPGPCDEFSIECYEIIDECENDGNGSITISVNGGTQPYIYNWTDDQSGNPAIGLSDGTYTVTVTDGNGCTDVISCLVDDIYPDTRYCRILKMSPNEWGPPYECTQSWADKGGLDNDVRLYVIGTWDGVSYQWSTDWDKTSGGTSRWFQLNDLTEGTYTVDVIVTDDSPDCIQEFEYTVTVERAALDRELETRSNRNVDLDFNLIPNPAIDKVSLTRQGIEQIPYDLTILDISGRKIMQQNAIAADSYEIDLRDIAPGLYLVQIYVENNIVVKKLIVER